MPAKPISFQDTEFKQPPWDGKRHENRKDNYFSYTKTNTHLN